MSWIRSHQLSGDSPGARAFLVAGAVLFLFITPLAAADPPNILFILVEDIPT